MTKHYRSISHWIFFLLATFLIIPSAEASVDREVDVKDPHHKGLVSSLNLGIRYSSILESRGVVLYRDFQVDPVVGVFLFDDKLEFLGDSLGYRDFVYEDQVRLRSRLVSVTDKPLFPAYDSVRNGNPDRPETYEWNSRIELFLPGYNGHYSGEIDFGYAKDISAHHGNYFDVQSKVKLFRYRLPFAGSLIEPNFYTAVGWGDSHHNQYFYGPTANESGFNNLSYGLWFAFPEDADRYYPIIQLTHFEILGDTNKAASYANGRGEGWLFSFIATVGVLE
jgi:hypothetical protein